MGEVSICAKLMINLSDKISRIGHVSRKPIARSDSALTVARSCSFASGSVYLQAASAIIAGKDLRTTVARSMIFFAVHVKP